MESLSGERAAGHANHKADDFDRARVSGMARTPSRRCQEEKTPIVKLRDLQTGNGVPETP